MMPTVLRRLCRTALCVGMALAVPGCGGDSATTPAPGISMVAVPPAPIVTSPSQVAPPPAPPAGSNMAPAPAPAPPAGATSAVIVQSGDSIGAGLGADDWAAINHLGFPGSVAIHNVSVSGKAMEAGYGQRAVELFPFQNNQVPSVLLIQQGSNDLYYGTKGDLLYHAILAPFVSSARTAGFYVVVNTVLPREDGGWTPTMEQQRTSYNALVRANGAGADAINDVAADPQIGDGSNPARSPLYADAVHPNRAGQERLVVLHAAVLGRFLQLPPRTRRQ